MARVRRRDTGPEIALRKALWARGARYRTTHAAGLLGSPDIRFQRLRIAVFVDGCFWHGCPTHGTRPKTNSEFWAAKIVRNRQRDREVDRQLRREGWIVVRLWQHEVEVDVEKCVDRIVAALRARHAPAVTKNPELARRVSSLVRISRPLI